MQQQIYRRKPLNVGLSLTSDDRQTTPVSRQWSGSPPKFRPNRLFIANLPWKFHPSPFGIALSC